MDAATRLLVIAPHPDDETLATGGLLQRARAVDAAVSVLFLTRGDNNPWPQRWLERRWRLDAAARRRWGERRMAEARQALAQLGLPGSVATQFGWPDMGLTDQLVGDGDTMHARLAAHIEAFVPNLVIVPALGDGHPDHSAAHVLAMSVLATLGWQGQCLAYLVHGQAGRIAAVTIDLDEAQQADKRRALACHASQMSLSRKRLLRQVTAAEHFHALDAPVLGARGRAFPQIPAWLTPTFEMLVHAGARTRVERLGPPAASAARSPKSTAVAGPAYRKLCWRWRSPWIFDHWGWRQVPPGSPQSPLDRHSRTG